MPTAITPLANITLGANASSVTFSSISQTYRDLVLVINGISSTSGGSCTLRVNNDTTTNYSYILVEANNGSFSTKSGDANGLFTTWNYNELGSSSSVLIYNFNDFSATNKHKTMLARINNPSAGTISMACGRWNNTSAITSIKATGSFGIGTALALYGVSA